MISFSEKIANRRSESKFVCIGLDPNKDFFPDEDMAGQTGLKYNYRASPVFDLFVQIIDATEDVAAAYKLNPSFYLEWRDGEAVMRRLMTEIRTRGIPTILDGKYGDVYHTNQRLANYAFDVCQADALTVNPYAGFVNIEPFLRRSGKGVIIFCESTGQTNDIQNTEIVTLPQDDQTEARMTGGSGAEAVYVQYPHYKTIEPKTVSEFVARRVSQMRYHVFAELWLTAPGDKPNRIARLREIAPSVPFLIPGVGEQGGDVATTARAAGSNCIISVSRALEYVGEGVFRGSDNFASRVQRGAVWYNHRIEQAMTQLV